MNAYVAYCAALAGKMHEDHVREERRRMAERRAHARPGYGRRASDVLRGAGVEPFVSAGDMVAPEPTYRVLNGRCAGQIVPESDTVECPREYLFGCDGTGTVRHWIRDDEAVEVRCPVCRGVGRILGIPDAGAEVQRLEVVVEGPHVAGRPAANQQSV